MEYSSARAARPLGLVCRFSIAATLFFGWILLPRGQAQTQGSWDGPYSWPYVIAASTGPKEISHAALIPTGLHAGKVLLFSWRRGNLATDTFWIFDPSNPADLIEFKQLLNSNIFCSGMSFDPSGRLVVAGGQGPTTPADCYRLDFQKLGPVAIPVPPQTGGGKITYSTSSPPWRMSVPV